MAIIKSSICHENPHIHLFLNSKYEKEDLLLLITAYFDVNFPSIEISPLNRRNIKILSHFVQTVVNLTKSKLDPDMSRYILI